MQWFKRFAMALAILCVMGSASVSAKTVLRVQHSVFGDDGIKLMLQYAEEYERLNPDVEIDLSYVPWENHRAVTMAKFMSGEVPDVLHSASAQASAELYNMGLLTDLRSYLDQDPGFRDDFIPATWSEIDYRGIPLVQSPEAVIFYRKDLFEEAGLPLPPVDTPLSWDQFIEYAKALTVDRDGDGIIDQWGFVERGQSGFIFMKSTIPLMWSFGVDVIERQGEEWVSGFGNPAAEDFVQFYVDLTRTHKVRPEAYLGWGYAEGMRAWAEGRIAMINIGGWFADAVVAETGMTFGEEWDIMLFPTAGDGEPFLYETLDYFHIPAAAKNKDEAWAFIRWLYEPERLQGLARVSHDLAPARASVLELPYYSPEKKPVWGARLSRWADAGRFQPTHPAYTEIWTGIVEPILQQAVQGRISVHDAVSRLDRDITQALKRYQ